MGQKVVFFLVMAIAVSLTPLAQAEDFGSYGGGYSVATVGSDGGSGYGNYTNVGTALNEMYGGEANTPAESTQTVSSGTATIPAVLNEMYGNSAASTDSTSNSGKVVSLVQATPELMQNPAVKNAIQDYVNKAAGTVHMNIWQESKTNYYGTDSTTPTSAYTQEKLDTENILGRSGYFDGSGTISLSDGSFIHNQQGWTWLNAWKNQNEITLANSNNAQLKFELASGEIKSITVKEDSTVPSANERTIEIDSTSPLFVQPDISATLGTGVKVTRMGNSDGYSNNDRDNGNGQNNGNGEDAPVLFYSASNCGIYTKNGMPAIVTTDPIVKANFAEDLSITLTTDKGAKIIVDKNGLVSQK